MNTMTPSPPAASQAPSFGGGPLHPAGLVTQLLAFLTITSLLVAASLMGRWTIETSLLVLVAFVAGPVIALVVDLRAFTRQVPGFLLSFAVLAVLGILIAWIGRDRTDLLIIAPAVALVFLGLDWYWAERLRALVWLSAVAALVFAAGSSPGALVVAGVWLVFALGTHGAAERDIARAASASALPGRPPNDAPVPSSGLVSAIASAVGIGLFVALLINLALLLNRPKPPPPKLSAADSSAFDQADAGGGQTVGGGGSNRGADGKPMTGDGGYASDGDGDGRADTADGRPIERLSDDGTSAGEGPGQGPGQASTGGRCERGRGCVAAPGNDRIVIDQDGRVVIDTNSDGNYDMYRDGRLGIDYNSDRIVDSWDIRQIITDADGDGRIAIDGNHDGKAERYQLGDVGLDTDGDGVIDLDGAGRVGVDTDADGRLDDMSPGWIRVDTNGNTIPDTDGYGRRLPSDPAVVIADSYDPNRPVGEDGQGSGELQSPNQSSESQSPTTRSSASPDSPASPESTPGKSSEPADYSGFAKILLAVAIATIVGVIASTLIGYWRRKRDEEVERVAQLGELASKRWALETLARLEREGRERGRRKRRSESVLTYATALAAAELPDERVVEVGRVLDGDLFSPTTASHETRRWVEHVLDEVCSAYPVGWNDESSNPRGRDLARTGP